MDIASLGPGNTWRRMAVGLRRLRTCQSSPRGNHASLPLRPAHRLRAVHEFHGRNRRGSESCIQVSGTCYTPCSAAQSGNHF